MKVIKIIVAVLGVLAVIMVGGSFFIKKDFSMEHKVHVKAPSEAVFNQLNTMKDWKNWSYWFQMDKAMKTTYSGPEMGVGAGYSWSSKKWTVGKGSFKITESVPSDKIGYELAFDGMDGVTSGTYSLTPSGEEVDVICTFNTECTDIIGKWMSLIMKGQMEKAFNESFKNMENYFNQNPDALKPIEPFVDTIPQF
ncbi:MAG: SRPBCC family protein [Chitinophagales bacterium]|nr:SRPBCC family protein [Chitinophagales bacterium]